MPRLRDVAFRRTALWSAGLSKTFPLHFTEQARMRFETTFTNLPNHVNLGRPEMRACLENLRHYVEEGSARPCSPSPSLSRAAIRMPLRLFGAVGSLVSQR